LVRRRVITALHAPFVVKVVFGACISNSNANPCNRMIFKNKRDNLYVVLFLILLANALLAEIIGPKLFSLNKTFEYLFGNDVFSGEVTMSAGVLIWPVVFTVTDLVNHYFGRKGVMRITYTILVFLVYAMIVLYASTAVPASNSWIELNSMDLEGNPFNIDRAYTKINRQGINIIIGSLCAFFASQFSDAIIYHRVRNLKHINTISRRALLSTIFSQLVDSFVVLTVAFYLLGNWSFATVVSVGTVQYIYKFIVAILLVPALMLMHKGIEKYLGNEAKLEAQSALEG
jgi:uncharacterized integral membrane protein (TIGR00697 family)